MKNYALILLSFFAILFTSCESKKEPVRFSPYTPEYHRLIGNVESVTEKVYDKKSKLLSTEQFDFNNSMRLLSHKYYDNIELGDTSCTYYKYDASGRIENIQSPYIAQYTPVFNEFGDLVKETIVGGGDEMDTGLSYTQYFEYDENGNVTKVTTEYSPDNITTTEYYYDNKKLRYVHKCDGNDNLIFDCDDSGLIISKKAYDKYGNKVLSQSTYTYTLDAQGNWVEKIEKEKSKVKSTTKREITYYLDSEMASIQTEKQENNYYVYQDPNESHIGIKFIDTYINDVLSRNRNGGDSPSTVLSIILAICTLILTVIGCFMASSYIFEDFTGEVQSNGMKKMWMYNTEPYTKVGSILLIGLGAFVVSILLILLVGGVIWGLLWLVKLILWAIIVIGWICLIGGVLGLLAKEGFGCLGVIIGGVIVAFQDKIEQTGEDLVNWGFEFMQSVNMFGWGVGLFHYYWDVIFFTFLSPFAIFLAIAFTLIVISLLLNGFEYIVAKIYSIRRPCPSCGSTETPEYIIGGKPHPVALHPGIYGIFTQKSPVTNKNVPTMFINGKGKLQRRCPNCNTYINSDAEHTLGTDIHIGIVGHRSSGKSYLLYSGLSSLMNTYPERFSQIDVDDNTRIEELKKRIDSHDGIQTNDSNKYRAVQLMLTTKFRPVPYHLFFYDVAGEKFNSASDSQNTAMDFYKNVQSIAFIIDPSMLDIVGTPTSEEFEKWHKEHSQGETYHADDAYSVLIDILEKEGRKSAKIDFSFICTKKDMGYFSATGYSENPSEEEIKRCMIEQMGLRNLINSANASFKNIHFYAVSAIDTDTSNLEQIFEDLLKQRNIKL